MQPTLDALDRGVTQLFSRPPRRRSLLHDQKHLRALPQTPSSSSRSSAFPQTHPLCECLGLQPLPDDWQHLRRHPVLKRYVLSRWQELCNQHDLAQQQQQQQDKLGSPSLSSSVSAAYARGRAVVAQSVKVLCVVLYQCGLLHVREIEFVHLLVSHTLTHGLGDVLLSVRESHTSELPLRVRMLLLHVVLEQIAGTNQSRDSNSSYVLQSDATKQRLIDDLCTSLQDEVVEALTNNSNKKTRARAFAGGGDGCAERSATATPRKANATTGRKTALRREPKPSNSSAFAPKCTFCHQHEELNSTSGTSTTPWHELPRLLLTVREILNGIESGSLLSEANSKPVMLKLAALRNLLLRSDVKRRLATRESAQRQHQHQCYQHQALNHAEATKQWSVTVTTYQQLRWSILSQTDYAISDVNMALWENVWEKELSRFSLSTASHVRVDEVIAHCAKADFFARIPKPARPSRSNDSITASLPGYRLVCQVLRALQVDCFAVIMLFLQTWTSAATSSSDYHHHTRQVRALTSKPRATMVSNSAAEICRSYLVQLLSEAERWLSWSQDVEKSMNKETVNGEHLVELLHSLFTIFADAFCGDGDGSQWPSYCRLWDRILQLSQRGDACTTGQSAGMIWLSGLVLCCNQFNNTSANADGHHDGAFKTAFTSYVLRVLRTVVVENGQSISSGRGSLRQPLVRSEDDLNFVRDAAASILVTSSLSEQVGSSQNSQVTSELVVQLLQSQMHNHCRAWSLEATLRYQRGLGQIFFPALGSCIRALSKNLSSSAPARANINEEEQFVAILLQATERLKAIHGSQAATIALLSFCTDWDIYQLKTRGGTNTASRRATKSLRLWGRASFLKLQLFADILRIYESESVLIQERDDVLQFLGDVLQSVTNCSPVLEGKLFRLLTGIKSRLESHHSHRSLPVPLPSPSDGDHQQQADEAPAPLPFVPGAGVKPTSLVSHSSDPLALFMHQLHTGTILQVREAVEKVKSDPVQLKELLRHVQRWIVLLQLQDSRSSGAFGKETKLSFALLCNRLLCWLPDESIHEIRQAVTPLDQALVQSLTAFAGGYGTQAEDDNSLHMNIGESIVSTGSSVRLELLIRSFVYSCVAPDLCELTDVIVNAIIGCTSTESRDALLKITQRISSVLLVEVAIETLRVSLSTECLSYLDRASHNAEDEDEENSPPGEAINRVSNALSIVGLSSALFGCNDISWSASLFDEQAVQHWLLCFFDCMVYSEQSRALTPIDELLSSLEFLMQAPQGTRMVTHSYLLAALLCTAAFPQSRIPQAQWSDFDTSLLEIAQALLGALSHPVSAAATDQVSEEDNDGDSEVLFVHVESLRVTRAKASEVKLELSTKVSAQVSTPLAKRLQNGYLVGDESHELAELEHRVFVRFSTWLSSAIIYSQSIAAALTSSSTGSDGGGDEHSWEQLFVDYVVYLFLPLEFEGCVSRLLETWVSVWMRMNLEHAGGELLLLLPFQHKLFSRLSATPRLQSHYYTRKDPDPVWTLVFTCVHSVLESVGGNPDTVDAAIVVLDDVMDKFDLTSLSTMSGLSHTTELLDQFEAVCAHPSIALLTDIQVIHVLKYPLELVAFCHVTMPPSVEYLVISSESPPPPPKWEVERVFKSLQSSLHGPRAASSPRSESEENGGQLSAEMSAFWYEWTQMIQLKLAFLDPIRCEQLIVAATRAVADLELE